MCGMPIKEGIIPNMPFSPSRPLLVILIISVNVDFVIPGKSYYLVLNICVLTIKITVSWQQTWTNHWILMNIYLDAHEPSAQCLSQFFYCNFSYVLLCSESNISHHSGDICQIFTIVLIWWLMIHTTGIN